MTITFLFTLMKATFVVKHAIFVVVSSRVSKGLNTMHLVVIGT